jgi:lethal(2) giant larvae protein
MHRAPVVGIVVLDGHGSPLPEPLEVAHDLARSADMQGCHQLLVISEEQFKVRTHTHILPTHTHLMGRLYLATG